MRLFISIQFDSEILNVLINLQDDLRNQGVTGNFTKPENLHLTLAFIGDYGNPDDVMGALEQSEFCPFSIKLDGVGTFGEIFWAGIADDPGLMAYTKRLRRMLAEYDIPFDKKRFSPHITLIRKTKYRNGKAIPVLDAPVGEMVVECISLMNSERGKNGMIYTEIGSIGNDMLPSGRQIK